MKTRPNASPRARRALKRQNIEIADMRLPGSGPRGRIVERDVLQWANEQAEKKIKTVSSAPVFRLRASCDAAKFSMLVARHAKNDAWNAGDLISLCLARAWREVTSQCCRVGLFEGVRSNSGENAVGIFAKRGRILCLGEIERCSLAQIAQEREEGATEAACDAVLCFHENAFAEEIEAPLFGSACSFGVVLRDEKFRVCLSFDAEKMELRDADELLGALCARLENPNLLFFN